MAEDKKDKKGGDEGGGGSNLFVDAIFWILLVLVAFSVIKGLGQGLNISFNFPSLTEIFASIFGSVQIVSVFFSLLFVIGIIYYQIKLGDLLHSGHGSHGHGHGHEHEEHHDHADTPADEHGHNHDHAEDHHAEKPVHYAPVPKEEPQKRAVNPRWQSVLTRLGSLSEGDWRLAVIEADIILDEMLSRMGYHGEGIGEKLKNVEKSDFATLDLAWEAHKIRNRIAHDGPAFHLTHNEAKRVIGLFQKVFEEFYFI
jgi:hypothetical protein